MKTFLVIFSILISLFGKNTTQNNLVAYNGEIQHIFSHCLIAYPSIAFNDNNSMKRHYETDCITKNEFQDILTQLYQNNYILVDINSIFTISNGKAIKKQLFLPKNKKPLVLSFDDVNYDHKKIGKGMVDKIIVTNGRLATSTMFGEEELISYDNEFVTILNNFIKLNPNFSHNGARATINLTGYDGILGYRTNSSNKVNREKEIVKAKEVISALKKSGYNFASHSYGHYHMKKISVGQFKEELELWKNEVEPLVGKTNIYVYPYGEWEIVKDGELSKKHKLLCDYGFKLFCGVGFKPFFGYLPFDNSIKEKSLFMDRRPIDGYTILNKTVELTSMFNCNEIYDKLRKNLYYNSRLNQHD